MKKFKHAESQSPIYREWRKYPTLYELSELLQGRSDSNCDLITSVDKITEVREIAKVILGGISDYQAKNSEEALAICAELEKISSELKNISGEFDSACSQVDAVRRNLRLHGSTGQPPNFSAEHVADTSDGLGVSESIHPRDSSAPLDIDRLISLVKRYGVRVEDLRGDDGSGAVYLSLTERPCEEVAVALKRLRALGATVWPGGEFLPEE
jgi:hypothetical protein